MLCCVAKCIANDSKNIETLFVGHFSSNQKPAWRWGLWDPVEPAGILWVFHGMERNVTGLLQGWNKNVRDSRGNVVLFDFCGAAVTKEWFSNC